MNITSTHANFSVDDLTQAKDFYEKLGFITKRESTGELLMESPAGTHVQIYAKDNHEPWDSTVLGIEVDDLEDALHDLAEQGVYPEMVEGTDDKGIATMDELVASWIKDPAGNWVCISQMNE